MDLPDIAITNLCKTPFYHDVVYQKNTIWVDTVVDTITLFHITTENNEPMITPFVEDFKNTVDNGAKVPSYGLSSYGYDVRITDDIKIFTNSNGGIVDPLTHSDENFYKAAIKFNKDNGLRYFILPPNTYALGVTREFFNIPKNIIGNCIGKSTYARCGIGIETTPIEAGFKGQVVIEISNGTTLPAKIYIDGGIAQFQFRVGAGNCLSSYADGNRKYQGQTGITYAK